MKKLLYSATDKVHWLPKNTLVETYLCDELPPLELCPSAYAIVFKNRALLQSDLREGERPIRMLDVPGGHVDEGETPDVCAVREAFEETGVRVTNPRLVAYKKITHQDPKPEGWRYPYPTGYMLFYLCEVLEETPFDGNDDTHGRVWLESNEYEKSPWYVGDKVMVDEIIKEYLTN